MGKLQVFDRSGNPAAEVEIADSVFAYPEKGHLVYEAVRSYRANQRQGTAATKTRAFVRGGGTSVAIRASSSSGVSARQSAPSRGLFIR